LRANPFFFAFLRSEDRLRVASIANLKPARAFALDHDLAMQMAQFDLANVAASDIDLLRDQGRALKTSARFALRNISAEIDAYFGWLGIEVRLKHGGAKHRQRFFGFVS
jgi:hypothetical protein